MDIIIVVVVIVIRLYSVAPLLPQDSLRQELHQSSAAHHQLAPQRTKTSARLS
jgi:hypothetical protein